jgi:hypothetical protein
MSARATSIALIVTGALLIWPVDSLLGAVGVAAIGAILIAVGLGGALADEANARRGGEQRSRR